MNLMEAFTALDNLNEDVYTVDADGIKKLQDFVQNDDTVDELDVFNLDAEPDTVIDENECHIGDAILDCCICHSKIFKPVAEVVVDEESQVANKGEECPYCYSVEGYKVVGEVTPADNDEDVVEINNEDNIEVGAEQIEEDIDEVNISTDDVDIEIEDKDSDNEIIVTDNSTFEFDISDDSAESTKYEGRIEESKHGRGRKNSVKEAIDLAAKDNTVAGILRQHMDELSSIFDPNELRNKVIEIVDSSDIADKPVANKLKKALFSKKSVGALLSTIATYMTGDKVVKTGRYKKYANESFKRIDLREAKRNESCKNEQLREYYDEDEEELGDKYFTKAEKFLKRKYSVLKNKDVYLEPSTQGGVGSVFLFVDSIPVGPEDDDEDIPGIDYEELMDYAYDNDVKGFIKLIDDTYGPFLRIQNESIKRKSIKESDGNEETIGDKLKKYQMWVDYDMEHYGKVSETTQDIINKEGLQLIKDQYGDYEVSVGSYKAESFKRSRKGRFVKEGLDSIEITSDDLKVSIETDDEKDNEEVVADVVEEPCDECSEEQVIAPVDEETKAEIEFDADDIDEDAIEDAVEECLIESFSNVKFFKCSNLTTRKNRIIVEGIVGFKSGKKKNTSFVFRPSLKTESVIKFRGYNKDLRESAKSINLICKKTGKKVIAESLKVKK